MDHLSHASEHGLKNERMYSVNALNRKDFVEKISDTLRVQELVSICLYSCAYQVWIKYESQIGHAV